MRTTVIPSDYHQHLERGPLAREWVMRFIDRGAGRGVQEFGFSEHCDRFREAAHLRCNQWPERDLVSIADYFALLGAVQAEGYPIRIGVEVDYLPHLVGETGRFLAQYPFDYVLGAVHWIGPFGFDDPRRLADWTGRDTDETYAAYFGLLAQAAGSGLFDCLAHPDVIKLFGHRPSRPVLDFARPALEAAARAGVALEVNAAGLRKPVGEIYPARELLEGARALGIPITLGSDAHAPEDAGRDLDRCVALAREAGYTECLRFQRRAAVPTTLG